MFTDERRCDVWEQFRQHGIRSFAEQVTPTVVAEAALRCGVVVAKSPLCVANLAWLGIAAALHKTESFASILTTTLKLLEDQQSFYSTALGKAKQQGQRKQQRREKSKSKAKGKKCRSKHDPRRDDPTQVSEEAFVKARTRMPLAFWMQLIIQARMVMLQFPLARLPYRYELCPLDQGEVTIARRLCQHLEQNDLLLLDACFWSYGLLWDIQNRGAFFALPMKRKINLKRVKIGFA